MNCTVTDLVSVNDAKECLTGLQFTNNWFSAKTVPFTVYHRTVTVYLFVIHDLSSVNRYESAYMLIGLAFFPELYIS